MAAPLWGNQAVLDKCTSLQVYLNSGHHVRLFRNNFPPDPSTPIASFSECNFTGYSAIALAGVFTGPTFVQNGQYQLDSGILTWTCTGGSSQVIYGWWIDDGTHMKSCQLLDAPFTIVAGGIYTLDLRPQEISQSILG